MAYKSLYRSYRPQTFSEVIGQQHIVVTLKNAIARDQLAHAYLFTGSRGTGKTTIAKLLAKGINCLHPEKAPCNECEMCEAINQESHPDIIEIDAASNNGVDDVRDLIERVKYAPLQAKKKVYIIDEVHMLSQGAFNALLKTLEEPPEHVVFILATTEVHKVLPTIISRCQRYDFTRISPDDIIYNLNRIIKAEGLKVEEGVVESIANLADGGHRDSLTILEQVIAYSQSPITVKDLQELYRISSPEDKKELLVALFEKDLVKALENLKALESKSIDYYRYLFDMINLIKETLVFSMTKDKENVSGLNLRVVEELDAFHQSELLIEFVNDCIKIAQEGRLNGQYQSYLEVSVLNLLNNIYGALKTNTQKEEVKAEAPVKDAKKEPKKVVEKKAELPKEEIIKEDVILDEPEILESTEEEFQETPNEDDQFYIELMVLGDKAQRESDQKDWKQKDNYLSELKYRRLNYLLNQSDLRISNKEFVVVVVPTSTEVSALLDETNVELFNELVTQLLGTRKVYVVEALRFNTITNKFMDLYRKQELPDPNQISIDFSVDSLDEEPEIDVETRLRELLPNLKVED